MDLEKLMKTLSSLNQTEDIPKGEFCSKDLIDSGMSRYQASSTIRNLADGGRIKFTTKRPTKNVTGGMSMVPYYKLEVKK